MKVSHRYYHLLVRCGSLTLVLDNWFAWKYKGYLRLQAKDYDKAIEALSQALRIEEKYVLTRVIRCTISTLTFLFRWSFAWAKLGYAFIKQKRYYEALPCYAKALEYTPGDVTSLYYKGKAHFHTQDFNEARACFDKVLEQPQNFKNSYYYKGKMLVTEQKISMAIQCFNKALERSPNKVTVHNEKGTCHRLRSY
jgi:tetratricopeptide (TPR) repeat protein